MAVTAGATYVVSYFAPVGRYAADEGYFGTSSYDNGPLSALRDGQDGGNGVYRYGSPGGFPTLSFGSTNYYVDPVFTTSATPPPSDTTPPTVTSRTPAAGATGVPTSTSVTATFSESVDPASVSVILRDPNGTAVAGPTPPLPYDAASRTVTFAPSSALAAGTTYTATVSGAKDTAGNVMTATSWSFTTAPASPPQDTTPPTVTSRTPAAGATGMPTSTSVTATFSESVDPASVSVILRDPNGTAVAGPTPPLPYDAASRTVTFTPSSALAAGTTYTATVSGAKDTAGNVMTATSWSFTTAPATPPPSGCPCTLFASTARPVTAASTDRKAVEVGVRFRADVDGLVTGVRFYKGTGNTGTHLGRLWSNTGTQLASATFSGETTSGWQQVNFATPVRVTAGTTYVASYYAPVGRYAEDEGYFATAGTDNAPLHAPADTAGAPNGVV